MKKIVPIITTERLYLRECTPKDAQYAYELNLDERVIQYTGDPPFSSIEEAQLFLTQYDDFKRHRMGRWYVFLRNNHEFLGWCGLKYTPEKNEVDLGYRFLFKHWNKGYASEAAKACLHYGFNVLQIEEIIARADQRNIGSYRVMEKVGMTYLKDIDFLGHQGFVYYATKETWNK